VTRRKARLILHHGEVRGYKLTPKQRRYFGARASGYPVRNAHPLLAAMWRGTKAGYHVYRATKLEAKAKAHRAKATLNPKWDVGEVVQFRTSGKRKKLPAHRHLNPRRVIPGQALEIRYLRSDGKRYFHPFKPGVKMYANGDGSVTLRGRMRIHADDREPQFWERYGHGRHGKVKNPRRRRRQSYGGGNNLLLYAGLALILYPLLTRNAYGVTTGGQMILPQPGESVWYSDPYQGGGGEFFTGSLPPGASPPWRLASATEIGAMQSGLLSGSLAQAGGGLVAPAPGFIT
jgi:hypothetical protein